MNKWKLKPIDRNTPDLFPASIQGYLPEDHMARFVVDVVEQLDLSLLIKSYRGSGSKAWHPAMMVSLLFYGYSTGIFSSRKLEKQLKKRSQTSCPWQIRRINKRCQKDSPYPMKSGAEKIVWQSLPEQKKSAQFLSGFTYSFELLRKRFSFIENGRQQMSQVIRTFLIKLEGQISQVD